MILIVRGLPQEGEATRLAAIEGREVARVRDLIVREGREPSSDEIGTLYRCAGDLLYRRQGRKCAYCERCEERRRNDVEHFRPKAHANRLPGSALTHGYWWLAWRWDNLLFACRNCNQIVSRERGKQDHFPLGVGSAVLTAEQVPGQCAIAEDTLLLDPASESAMEHFRFERLSVGGALQWRPRPLTEKGAQTIRVCALDRDDLLDDYVEHVESIVRTQVQRLDALGHPVADDVWRRTWMDIEAWLYTRTRPFVALSYDALKVLVPDEDLAERRATRRRPAECWG